MSQVFPSRRILRLMRLPFLRSRTDSGLTVAEALERLEGRLDRLIATGERTNELLERGEWPGAEQSREIDERDEPKPPRPAARAPRQGPTKIPSPRRRKAADGGPERPAGRAAGPVKLHTAIIRVLLDAGEPLTADDIAARIRDRNLYEPPRSGHELRGSQVSARVGNATYRHRFIRRKGLIWLADPDAERLRITIP